jgi:dolichol-phosphate mannosyltransferase
MNTPVFSVVIPLKNEEENITELIHELEPVMKELRKPWELICIDDGSTDRTRAILHELCEQKTYLRVIFFSRNYGQASAFDAGFKAAKGEYVITLDGDCQNDPADIPKLIEKISHYDIVCGRRVKRKDPFSKKIISWVANKVRQKICGDGISDTGCSLKIYRTACLRNLKLFQGMHRFLPALFMVEGYRVAEVNVNHRPRTRGQTKYHFFNRSLNTVVDMLAVRWMRKRSLKYKIEKEND